MENKIFNKRTLFIILGVLLLGVLTVLGTYAYYAWSSTSEDKDATVAVSSVNGLGECDKVTDNRKILWPVSSRNNGRIVNINAKQMLSEYAFITWTLTIDSINTQDTETDGLKHRSFKYELVNTTTGVSYGSGNFEGKDVGDTITFSNNTENLAYDTNYTFTLYLWIDGTIGRNPSDITDQTYQFSLVCDITGEGTNKVHEQIVPPITVEPTDASLFNYTIENNEVTITGYKSGGTCTYTVTDQSACESYLVNSCGCESDTECISEATTSATALCSSGSVGGMTLGDAIAQGFIPSTDYSAVGLSNVVITPAPTDVIIPNEINGHSVTSIGSNALKNKGLTSVVIPSSVTSIGTGAFDNNSLTSITIKNENVTIDNCAFGQNPPLDEPFLSNYVCRAIINPGCTGEACYSD